MSRRDGSLAASKRKRTTIVLALVALLVVVGGAAAAVFAVQYRDSSRVAPVALPAQPANITYRPDIVAVDPAVAKPSPAGVATRLRAVLANPSLGDLTGRVTDAATGAVLWERAPGRARVPASTTKILTAAAMLLTMPTDARLTTRVVEGARRGQLILVGAGDATLTATDPGKTPFLSGGGRMADLTAQIRAAGTEVTSIGVDTSLYSGREMAIGWMDEDIAGGYITPIEAVMTDSGRMVDPFTDYSPRTATPALDAGRVLARQLGVPVSAVTRAEAAPTAKVVARVTSQTVDVRMRQAMVLSDNVLAQTIGMEIAKATNHPVSIEGSAQAVLDALRTNGFNTSGVILHDTNGLSNRNQVPASLLDAIIGAATSSKYPKLRPLLDYLPIAGATGTLEDRYTEVNRAGAGYVRAKTGTLSGINTLAGFVNDKDGRVLAFALMSSGPNGDVSRPAMDAITTALRGCGCR